MCHKKMVTVHGCRFTVHRLRPLKNHSIVIANEANLCRGGATSRHASLAAKDLLAPRNDQNWAKVWVMQRSLCWGINGLD